ncbi:MAG: erythromycin esterase family protein [Saprospiraceae bacterium]|nr:erythromycin esterase family protein [Saprospiraceae bacterium]
MQCWSNSTIVANAEQYYRSMIKGGPHSWNVRDRHMHETLVNLLQFHGKFKSHHLGSQHPRR